MRIAITCLTTLLLVITMVTISTTQRPDKVDRAACSFENSKFKVFIRGSKLVLQRNFYVKWTNARNTTRVFKRSKYCFIGGIKITRILSNGTSLVSRLGGVGKGRLQGKFECNLDKDESVLNTRREDGSPVRALTFSISKGLTTGSEAPTFNAKIYVMKEAGNYTSSDGSVIGLKRGDPKWEFSFDKPAGCSEFICGDVGEEVASIRVDWVVHCAVRRVIRRKLSADTCGGRKTVCFDMGGGARVFAPMKVKKDGVIRELVQNIIEMGETDDTDVGGKASTLSVTFDNDFTQSLFYDPLMQLPEDELEDGEPDTTPPSSSSPPTAFISIPTITLIMVLILLI